MQCIKFLALYSKKFAASSHTCSCLTLISPASTRLINIKCYFRVVLFSVQIPLMNSLLTINSALCPSIHQMK